MIERSPDTPELGAYHELVRLDEPFAPSPPLGAQEVPDVVTRLVEHLQSERGEERIAVSSLAQERALLRALLTVRPPNPLPDWFYHDLDGLLQHERLDRAVVEARSLQRISDAFPDSSYAAASSTVLWQGDITALEIDTIVNAANSQLLGCFQPGHRCIDNVIHAAAGPKVRADCHAIMQQQEHPEGTGLAKATRGYNLPARHILHTVGPIVQGALTPTHREQLASSYRSCLDLAARVDSIRSVAFCCISTGLFGFPQDAAARIALDTVANWLASHPGEIDLVVFNVFKQEDLDIYRSLLVA